MPRGVYEFADGAAERFSCAGGPAGWRYVSDRVDLVCDSGWRQIRVAVPGGLRGGVAGREVLWVRDGVERADTAAGFAGDSPAYAVATARMLRLAAGDSVRLHRLDVSTGLTRTEAWTLAEVTWHDELPVEHYDVMDVGSGERADWHVAGDVLLAGPDVELAELDGPPDLSGVTLEP